MEHLTGRTPAHGTFAADMQVALTMTAQSRF